MDKTLQSLQQLFKDLETTSDPKIRRQHLENQACNYKVFIRELCEENEKLKRMCLSLQTKLWEYENNYRMGSFPSAK